MYFVSQRMILATIETIFKRRFGLKIIKFFNRNVKLKIIVEDPLFSGKRPVSFVRETPNKVVETKNESLANSSLGCQQR